MKEQRKEEECDTTREQRRRGHKIRRDGDEGVTLQVEETEEEEELVLLCLSLL